MQLKLDYLLVKQSLMNGGCECISRESGRSPSLMGCSKEKNNMRTTLLKRTLMGKKIIMLQTIPRVRTVAHLQATTYSTFGQVILLEPMGF